MRVIAFLCCCFVGLAAAASSPLGSATDTAVLPLTYVSRLDAGDTIGALVAQGLARLAHFNSADPGSNQAPGAPSPNTQASGPATNDLVTYVVDTKIGASSYRLIIDTGSSNTWCGANNKYVPGPNSKTTGRNVHVNYGSGSFSGDEYTDSVTFSSLTVQAQSIGAATQSEGFHSVDGVLGFGPVDLTTGTVNGSDTVATFMNNLFQQGTIQHEVLGVYFRPEAGSDTSDTNGELTLGGTDSSKFNGDLTYVPKSTNGLAAYYWGIDLGSFTYGSSQLGGATTGIVDTGTTLVFIPSTVYNAFLKQTDGATDPASNMAYFTTRPTQNFNFVIGGRSFALTPDQYLVPQADYVYYGLDASKWYCWIADAGARKIDFVLGQKFLEAWYSVFDGADAGRIGFAQRA